ncbi:NIC-domain-containing protein [Anaeromyces robustus]|uniref:Nuclear pore protein n=1 Tax=Anaeromyces robustus TaxID=1754192 RepID=A0A1Y1X028_9FUNG|nr:NIC-domain-containing protein [Anaeromyces robustus]|eukprot:ORX79187.1 NIC-domain-containing protein [Anaeromyces robustus]
MKPDFNILLENSHQLISHILNNGLTPLKKNLDQIELQTRKLVAKASKDDSGIDSRAHYLLANKGFDAEHISQVLNNLTLNYTYEYQQPISDTDIEASLNTELDSIIYHSFEKSKSQTAKDNSDSYENSIYDSWEKTKQRILEELVQYSINVDDVNNTNNSIHQNTNIDYQIGFNPNHVFSFENQTSSITKKKKYAEVIEKFNNARIKDESFSLITNLKKCALELDSSTPNNSTNGYKINSIVESWELLSSIINEQELSKFKKSDKNGLYNYSIIDKERGTPMNAIDSIEIRKMITEGAKKYLENFFWKWIENKIVKNPKEAMLGGKPGVIQKIRAFLNITFKKYGEWENPIFELINNVPVWAQIYYLIRSGHYNEALKYVLSIEHELRSREEDSNFVDYFKAWLESPERKLSKYLRNRLLTEWNEHIRYIIDPVTNEIHGDPFKYALYKIIGRCDMTYKKIPGDIVMPTVEDYLWFHLILVQESHLTDEPNQERYGLREMSQTMQQFGPGFFQKGLQWFYVLLICGEFEKAVAYLFSIEKYQVEAVHFAIVLAYYSLLKVPLKPNNLETGLLTMDKTSNIVQFNFSRLIHQYCRSLKTFDTSTILNYIYIIALYGIDYSAKRNIYYSDIFYQSGKYYTDLTYMYLCEVILERNEFIDPKGEANIEGTKVLQDVENHSKLIYIHSPQEFIEKITKVAAQQCNDDGRINDAIVLFNMAKEYNTVISLLNKQLGDAIAQYKYSNTFISNDISLSPTKSTLSPNKVTIKYSDPLNRPMSSKNGRVPLTTKPKKDDTTSTKKIGNNDISRLMSQSLNDTIKVKTGPNYDIISVDMAEKILSYYLQQQYICNTISEKNRSTCTILIGLLKFMNYWKENKLEQAIHVFETLSLIPFDGDMAAIMKKANEFRSLDENITKNFPEILVIIMSCVHNMWCQYKQSSYNDETRQAKMLELQRKARVIVVFAGSIQFRMPGDIYSKISEMEVHMQ